MTITEAEIDAAIALRLEAEQTYYTERFMDATEASIADAGIAAVMQAEREATTKRERERAARKVLDDPVLTGLNLRIGGVDVRETLAAAIRGEQT